MATKDEFTPFLMDIVPVNLLKPQIPVWTAHAVRSISPHFLALFVTPIKRQSVSDILCIKESFFLPFSADLEISATSGIDMKDEILCDVSTFIAAMIHQQWNTIPCRQQLQILCSLRVANREDS